VLTNAIDYKFDIWPPKGFDLLDVLQILWGPKAAIATSYNDKYGKYGEMSTDSTFRWKPCVNTSWKKKIGFWSFVAIISRSGTRKLWAFCGATWRYTTGIYLRLETLMKEQAEIKKNRNAEQKITILLMPR